MVQLLDTLLAQCGFRRDRLTLAWLIGAGISLQLFLAVRQHHDLVITAVYFAATSAFYYLGNAACLAHRGARDEQGWNEYQCLLGLMFFNQTLGFTAVVALPITAPWPAAACFWIGGALAAAGVIIKTWATMVVGVDCYYYKDLFFRRRVWQLSRKGPYALLSSPMYGAGNLHLYGLALMARSLPGLCAAAFCHAAIYAFYHGLERPFVERIVAGDWERSRKLPPDLHTPVCSAIEQKRAITAGTRVAPVASDARMESRGSGRRL